MGKGISIAVVVVLVVALAGSMFLYFQQTGNLKEAQDEVTSLESKVSGLENDIISLESDVTSLENELDQAGGQISSLEGQIDAKDSQINSLEADVAAKRAEVSSLENELSSATDNIDSLQADLEGAQAEVESLGSDLAQAEQEKDGLVQELGTWEASYHGLSDQIYQKIGLDEDSTLYITPEEPAVVDLASQVTGGLSGDWDEHWADIFDLYLWILDNIEYDLDTPLPLLPDQPTGQIEWFAEYWRTPTETLSDLAGDCEDMATLLASLVASYEDQQFPTWCIGLASDISGHLAVALPVEGGNLVILDPAGDFYTGSGGQIDTTKSAYEATMEWLDAWAPQMPNVYVDMLFDTGFYQYFDSTSEFFGWVTSQ